MPQSFVPTIYFISAGGYEPASELMSWLQARYQNIFKVKSLLPTLLNPGWDLHECDLVIVMLHEGNLPFHRDAVWKKIRDWAMGLNPFPLIVVNPCTHPVDIKDIVDEEFANKIRGWFHVRFESGDLKDLYKTVAFHIGTICGIKGSRVFISYRRETGLPVARSIDALLRGDYVPFLDERIENTFGDIWETEIKPKLDRSNCLLLLDTEGVTNSSWVKKEYRFAFSKQMPILQVIWRKEGESRKGRIRELHPLSSTVILRGDGRAPISAPDFAKILDALDELLLREFKDRLRIVEDSISQFEELAYRTKFRQTLPILLDSHKPAVSEDGPKRVHSRINVRTPLHDLDVASFADAINAKNHKSEYPVNFLVHQDDEINQEDQERMDRAVSAERLPSASETADPVEKAKNHVIYHEYVFTHLLSI